MKRTQVYIPEELYAQVKALAGRTGISTSQLLRNGLYVIVQKFHVDEGRGPMDDLVGAFHCKGGDPDAALNHNEIYTAPFPWEQDAEPK